MDYGVYDLDFTREGRRRVYLFSYLLSYSRRQYLRFVEAMDLMTTLRGHVQAFHHLGGVARVCLYDNFKAVVLRHDADGPLYNPKFLAFATHYGFKPWACRVRRPQTKGKVERKFFYVLICEYCLSHYVAIFFVALARFQLLLEGFAGYLIAFFSVVWVANVYMSIFGRLRLGIKSERTDIEIKEEQLNQKSK